MKTIVTECLILIVATVAVCGRGLCEEADLLDGDKAHPWTSSAGTKIEAKLIGFAKKKTPDAIESCVTLLRAEDIVVLQKGDGKEIRVSLDKLSVESSQLAQEVNKQRRKRLADEKQKRLEEKRRKLLADSEKLDFADPNRYYEWTGSLGPKKLTNNPLKTKSPDVM